jgi:hypothetical protein
MLKPRRLLRQCLCASVRLRKFRIGDGQRPQQHPLHFGQRSWPRLDVVAPLERRLPQFLAQHRRVDAQLLRGVGGKLVPRQLLRHAPDVRQQKVHRLHLLLRAGAGKHLPRPLDQVIGLPPRPAQRFLVRPPRPARE